MTNFEKLQRDIKHMTVEQFISLMFNCHEAERSWNINCFDDSITSCEKCMTRWLKAEYKNPDKKNSARNSEPITAQEYCKTYFNVKPELPPGPDALRNWLDDNGYSNLKDYSPHRMELREWLDENSSSTSEHNESCDVDKTTTTKRKVVRVRIMYINSAGKIVSRIRWFETP